MFDDSVSEKLKRIRQTVQWNGTTECSFVNENNVKFDSI